MRRCLVLTVLLALGLAPAAQAAWFPTARVDGPSPDILALGGLDVARDGGGGMVYIKRDGGVPHVFLTRLVNGAWRAPERVDPGLDAPASEAKVSVADGSRLAVAWIAGGNVYATVAAAGSGPQPLGPPVAIAGPDADGLDLDMSINGAAYAVWQQGGDVRFARLQDTTWTGIATPLDIDPAETAGTSAGRPKVASSAEGYAVATWGEQRADGRMHVFARRITGTNLSVAPQDLTLDTIDNQFAGNADSPDIDIEDDGSFAWVVFRQDAGGASRTIARRLVGSLFEPPATLDGGLSTNEPRVDINGRGVGLAVTQTLNGAVLGSPLVNDALQPPLRLDAAGSTAPPQPEVATGEREDVAVAWRSQLPDGTVQAHGDHKPHDGAFDGDTAISTPDFGPVNENGIAAGADRIGDFAVGVLQGTDAGRSVSVASYDREPGVPFIRSSANYQRRSRPRLVWSPGVELWGPQTYKVFVDGVLIGQTTATALMPKQPIAAGAHHWRVVAVDMRGQQSLSRDRLLRIDSLAPVVKAKISGKRRRGQRLKIFISARDRGGSGIASVSVDYGDGSPIGRLKSTVHRYRAGKFKLVAKAVDKAGNVGRYQVKLRIKR